MLPNRKRPSPLLLVTVFAMGGLVSAFACQICIPFPKRSAADFLLEADTVVLAREDPERPFHYAPIETLKGESTTEKIDLFLDSATRRKLTQYPEYSVVLAQLGDGRETAWQRIGTADQELGPIVREILAASADWESKPRQRIAFFARWLGHDNHQVRVLAHLEVARAPYDEIKKCGDALPPEEIRAFLNNFRYIEWHPLYILLLAQSDRATDHALIRDSFESTARFSLSPRLAAWATALIEISKAEGIAQIEELYFRNTERKREELQAVVLALSVHGNNGHTHLRELIVAAYGVLLENHPAMAPDLVHDLTAWEQFQFADQIAAFLTAHPKAFNFQETIQLQAYIAKASITDDGD